MNASGLCCRTALSRPRLVLTPPSPDVTARSSSTCPSTRAGRPPPIGFAAATLAPYLLTPLSTISFRNSAARRTRSGGKAPSCSSRSNWLERVGSKCTPRRSTTIERGGTQSAPSPADRTNPSSTSMSVVPDCWSSRSTDGAVLDIHTATGRVRSMSFSFDANWTGVRPFHSKGATVGLFQNAKPTAVPMSRFEWISSRQKAQSPIASRTGIGSSVNGFTYSKARSCSRTLGAEVCRAVLAFSFPVISNDARSLHLVDQQVDFRVRQVVSGS